MFTMLVDGQTVPDPGSARPYAPRHAVRTGPGRHGSGVVLRTPTDYVGRHARESVFRATLRRLAQGGAAPNRVRARSSW